MFAEKNKLWHPQQNMYFLCYPKRTEARAKIITSQNCNELWVTKITKYTSILLRKKTLKFCSRSVLHLKIDAEVTTNKKAQKHIGY